MDDRIEHSGDTAATTSNDIGRREMLQRTGFVVGAAALWATPVVQTMGMRPAAAVSAVTADFCIDCDGDPPIELVFRYSPSDGGLLVGDTGSGCSESSLVYGSGSSVGFGSDPVDIMVTYGGGGPNEVTVYYCGIVPNETILVGPGKLQPQMDVVITGADGITQQSIGIHTSCSSELRILDQFRSLTLVYGDDGANQEGTRGANPNPGQPGPCIEEL